MSATAEPTPAGPPPTPYIGKVDPSPAGPAGDDFDRLLPAPWAPGPQQLHMLRFNQRQAAFVSRARKEHGDVFRMKGTIRGNPTITSHPDHVRSLFTAKPDVEAVSITGESPLRPIVGPNSTLTAIGPRHLRQRKLMLPPFHGEAVARYSQMIADAADSEIDNWPVGKPIQLAPRMQAITLDVIMAGIFGIEGEPEPRSAEWGLRETVKRLVEASTWPTAQVYELVSVGKDEPTGFLKWALKPLDHYTFAVIKKRRAEATTDGADILSILLQARTEDGEQLTDQELRDELLTLVLAGHETTANSLSWTWERLVRNPEAYERLRAAVREGGDTADVIEATIVEGMRNRPVIPMIGRRVLVPWQLGEYGVKADRPIGMSILLLHHREDLYPDPFAFRPERWLGGRKPGTYEWIPFGGGIRRCLGASLAMAEQRVVLAAMARRLDLEYVTPEPETAVHRNVTMIPSDGARVIVRDKRPA